MKYQVYNVSTGQELTMPFDTEKGAIEYIASVNEYEEFNNLPESQLDYRVV